MWLYGKLLIIDIFITHSFVQVCIRACVRLIIHRNVKHLISCVFPCDMFHEPCQSVCKHLLRPLWTGPLSWNMFLFREQFPSSTIKIHYMCKVICIINGIEVVLVLLYYMTVIKLHIPFSFIKHFFLSLLCRRDLFNIVI